MGSSYATAPLIFLTEVLFGTYTLVVLLRFVLQLVRADFYNPVSQFVVKVTSPVLVPLRRIIPAIGTIDTASLALMWLLKTTELTLVLLFKGVGLQLIAAAVYSIPALVELAINLFLFAIFIQVILSWVSPGGHNPAISMLYSLTEPLLGPARRIIPPIGGIDLSPMAVMIGLVLLKMLLVPLLSPSGL